MTQDAQDTRHEWTLYAFLVAIGVVLILTVVAYFIFGFPELDTAPQAPE